MKILITGSEGFIAKNLIVHLQREEKYKLYTFSKDESLSLLKAYVEEVDFIFHLAGVNRPKDTNEFYVGNTNLTKFIIESLSVNFKSTPIVFSSSTQAALENDYGKSKKEAEIVLLEYAKEFNAKVFIYRLANVFGKWSKPNYNSVIATWSYNIARDLPIKMSDASIELELVYIDDVISSFMNKLSYPIDDIFIKIEPVYKKTLGEIKELLYTLKANRETLLIPEVGSGFKRALYATYLSFLPKENFSYELNGHKDSRGTFYEIIKTPNSGQFSLSTTAPGIIRGGHYHHTKNEKFLVVKGKAIIEFRHIITNEKITYEVSDAKMQIVEMIPGYTHNIKNIGDDEMILFLWANENFDPQNPDTYYEEV